MYNLPLHIPSVMQRIEMCFFVFLDDLWSGGQKVCRVCVANAIAPHWQMPGTGRELFSDWMAGLWKRAYFVFRCLTLLSMCSFSMACAMPFNSCRLSEGVLLSYHRSGGIAGREICLQIGDDNGLRLTQGGQQTLGSLQVAERQTLDELLTSIDFTEFVGAPPSLPTGADLMSYRIRYQEFTVQVVDMAIPPTLSPLIDWLDAHCRRLLYRYHSPDPMGREPEDIGMFSQGENMC